MSALTLALAAFAGASAARGQAMVRGEQALQSGGGAAAANAGGEDGDLTVRQTAAATPTIDQNPTASTSAEFINSAVDLGGNRGAAVLAQRARWRPIFYLNLGVAYDDNIFVSNFKEGDVVSTIEPGVIIAFGDFRDALPRLGNFEHFYDIPADPDTASQARFIYLDYHPTVYLFDKYSDQDSVDESVTLFGGYAFTHLGLGINLQYQQLSGDDVDAGGRVDRTLYNADLTSLYQYDEKTSLEFNLYFSDREYEAGFNSSREVTSRDLLNYQYGAKTQLSLGVVGGYVAYSNSNDQTYEQLIGRVTRLQFAKVDFSVTGGVEYRQSFGAGNRVTAVFSADATYHPYSSTTLALRAGRGTEPSALLSEDVTYTRVALELDQQLFSRLNLTLRGSYANADYQRVDSDQTNVSRGDDLEDLYASLAFDLTQYATFQLSYDFRNNSSNLASRTFTQNILSAEVRLTY